MDSTPSQSGTSLTYLTVRAARAAPGPSSIAAAASGLAAASVQPAHLFVLDSPPIFTVAAREALGVPLSLGMAALLCLLCVPRVRGRERRVAPRRWKS